MNNNLTLLDNSISIDGEHYTVSNGFVTKAYGEIRIRYKDLLAVEIVKQRSKKVMYTMLIPTGILLFVWNFESFIPMIPIAILAVIVCVMALMYFFSVRRFVEFTSMKGTYRIAVQRGDSEIETIITQLQSRIFSTK